MGKLIRSVSIVVSVALLLLFVVVRSLSAATSPPPQPVKVTNTPLPVAITNSSLTTVPAIPATAFSLIGAINDDSILGPHPAGTNYAITSVAFRNGAATAMSTGIFAKYGPTTDCDTFTGGVDQSSGPQVIVPPESTIQLTFPQPFIIKAKFGTQSCLHHNATTGVTIVGYTIPS